MRTISQDREEVWPLGSMKPKSDTLAGAELLRIQQYDSCTVSICHCFVFCFLFCHLFIDLNNKEACRMAKLVPRPEKK